jgi:hypothetical protein
LFFFSLSLQEKVDLEEVEINEQIIVIDELRNEIRFLNDKDEQPRLLSITKSNDEEKNLIEKLDKKLYELETERTCLVFEQERLKTNLDLCIDEKQHLIQQRIQTNNELKKLKLQVLGLQDQIHKFKRNIQTIEKKELVLTPPILSIKRRMIKKKPRRPKSCLEMLLDQNSTLVDDLQNESFISNKPRHHSCSLCDYHGEPSFIKRKRRPSISSVLSKQRCGLFNHFSKSEFRFLGGPIKRHSTNKIRIAIPFIRKSPTPPTRVNTNQYHILNFLLS